MSTQSDTLTSSKGFSVSFSGLVLSMKMPSTCSTCAGYIGAILTCRKSILGCTEAHALY